MPVHGVGEHGGVHYYAMQYIQGHGLDVILDDLRRLRAGAAALRPLADGERGKDDTGSMAVARSLLTGRVRSSRPDRDLGTHAHDFPDSEADSKPSTADLPAAAASISSVLSQSTESGYYRAVARLGIQVAEALAHAHGQGVLHRDIKPSNLLLDADGHVWVTDFGLAKFEGSDGPTQTGDIVGTLRYMAPERFDGWSDRRSDVYGLGMTLYELLTLKPAFDSADRLKLDRPDQDRGSPTAAAARPADPARPGDDRPEGDRQGAQGALPVGRCTGRRPAAIPRQRTDPGAAGGSPGAGLDLGQAAAGGSCTAGCQRCGSDGPSRRCRRPDLQRSVASSPQR